MCKPPPGSGSGMPSSVQSLHPSSLPSPSLPPCLPPSLPACLPSFFPPSLPLFLPSLLPSFLYFVFKSFAHSLTPSPLCVCVCVPVLLLSLYSNLAAAPTVLEEHCISSPASVRHSTSACGCVCLSLPLTTRQTNTIRDMNFLKPALMVV